MGTKDETPTISEMLRQEELLRLRARCLQREAASALAQAATLEETRLRAERLATPIAVVRSTGKVVPPSKSSVSAHRLALAASAAFGLTYAEAYKMVARAS